jgi:hypothetical protein
MLDTRCWILDTHIRSIQYNKEIYIFEYPASSI